MFLKAILVSAFVAIASGKGWVEYINQLKISEHIEEAAIIGTDGGLFARSSGFRASSDDLLRIAEQFNGYNSIPSQGIQLGNTKYSVVRAQQEFVYARQGQTGLVAYKTPRTIIIALFNVKDEETIASVRIAVLKLGENIKTAGF